MNANQIINIASDYKSKYHLNDDEEDEIKKILIEKGHKKFYIFRYISKVKNFLIISKNLQYKIEIPMRENREFLEDLNKACFIKIIKRKTKENVLHENEVYATVNVYY